MFCFIFPKHSDIQCVDLHGFLIVLLLINVWITPPTESTFLGTLNHHRHRHHYHRQEYYQKLCQLKPYHIHPPLARLLLKLVLTMVVILLFSIHSAMNHYWKHHLHRRFIGYLSQIVGIVILSQAILHRAIHQYLNVDIIQLRFYPVRAVSSQESSIRTHIILIIHCMCC